MVTIALAVPPLAQVSAAVAATVTSRRPELSGAGPAAGHVVWCTLQTGISLVSPFSVTVKSDPPFESISPHAAAALRHAGGRAEGRHAEDRHGQAAGERHDGLVHAVRGTAVDILDGHAAGRERERREGRDLQRAAGGRLRVTALGERAAVHAAGRCAARAVGQAVVEQVAVDAQVVDRVERQTDAALGLARRGKWPASVLASSRSSHRGRSWPRSLRRHSLADVAAELRDRLRDLALRVAGDGVGIAEEARLERRRTLTPRASACSSCSSRTASTWWR